MTLQARSGPVSGRPANNLLQRLNERDYALIHRYLDHVIAGPNRVLCNPGDRVEMVHFPCGPSLASLVVPMEDGRDVECLFVGREGAVGGIISRGRLPAYARIVVRLGGSFLRLPVTRLEAAKRRSPTMVDVFARYADCLVAQTLQSGACNAAHSIEQRAAKWMISTMERSGEAVVPFTHEQLAMMLGVGRSYASRVIRTFRAERILDSRRMALVVRDRGALAAKACRCDAAVKQHFADVLSGVYPDEDS